MRRAIVFPPRSLRAWLASRLTGGAPPRTRPRRSRGRCRTLQPGDPAPVGHQSPAPDRRPHRQQPFPARRAPRSSRACTRFCQDAGRLDRIPPEAAPAPRVHTFGLTRRSRRGRAPLRTRLPASCRPRATRRVNLRLIRVSRGLTRKRRSRGPRAARLEQATRDEVSIARRTAEAGQSPPPTLPQHSVGIRAVPIAFRCTEGTYGALPTARRKGPFCGPFEVELAGLEPATSWVRSSCSSEREMVCLQPVSGECLECRNTSRNISASDLQRDQCLRRQCPSAR